MWYTHIIEYYLSIISNDSVIYGTIQMALETLSSVRSQSKDHIIYNFFHI